MTDYTLTPEETYGKILILGRAQSGKTTIAAKISEMTGLKILKTCTTRPRRTPDEDTYHFYTEEEFGSIPESQKLFQTFAVDGHARWTNLGDFLSAGIAILDPTALTQAVQLWQSQGCRVTILYMNDNKVVRRTRWMHQMAADDGSDWDQAIAAFSQRDAMESCMFDPLEESIGLIQADAASHDAQSARKALAGEDRLQVFTSHGSISQEEFLPDFLGSLAAGARPAGGYRESNSKEDLVLEPEDWTEGQWRTICKILSLSPEDTARAVIAKPLVKYYSDPESGKLCLQDNNSSNNAFALLSADSQCTDISLRTFQDLESAQEAMRTELQEAAEGLGGGDETLGDDYAQLVTEDGLLFYWNIKAL